ncbi:MAG: class I SAM-dependent methyltransferase [Pseudanabaena frigida]|uniref:Class I SAM-dependent methyltransferase n=1 Tax=Pseudanabaena frigida TaxID=945775 RepID=A0A2W4VYB7_9CYAN|nr:MAG: class I SAM-dependent methyltransferase [Pseudanabaena frigida]
MTTDILQEQIQYYRDRASEYDEWFFRQGRYDRGEPHRQLWFSEVADVEVALGESKPSGDILELASGTGLWTQHLADFATTLTAVDASPEVIALNKQRLNSTSSKYSIKYIIADLFNWTPSQQYDFIFFGFWLSHVHPDRFTDFWQTVKNALKPDGCVFFVDSLFNPESTANNHTKLDRQGYSERKLNDGKTYRIVKIFHEPLQLKESLQQLGWSGNVHSTTNFFLHGLVHL